MATSNRVAPWGPEAEAMLEDSNGKRRVQCDPPSLTLRAAARGLSVLGIVGLVLGAVALAWSETTGPEPAVLAPGRVLIDSQSAVLDLQGAKVSIKVEGARCFAAQGPLSTSVGAGAAGLDVFSAQKRHVACFLHGAATEFHVLASSGGQLAEEGSFGFGAGVAVSLRPELATSATWALQADVRSLALTLDPKLAFRLLGVQVTAGGTTETFPFLVVRPRLTELPADVDFAKADAGSCTVVEKSEDPLVVCRSKDELVSQAVDLVVMCGDCAAGLASLSVKEQREEVAELDALVPKPWVSFGAIVPLSGTVKNFKISFTRHDGSVATEDQTLTVALVSGYTTVQIARKFENRPLVEISGRILFYVALGAGAAALLACVAMYLFLPTPVTALLPSASSALFVIQFLVCFGSAEHAPLQLKVLQESFAFLGAGDPWLMLRNCGIVLGAVCVMHGWAVLSYVVLNGSGSAEHLPHSLALGAWELRALPFVALPVAASATTIFRAGLTTYMEAVSSEADVATSPKMYMTLGVVLLVLLLAIALGVGFKVYDYVFHEQVVAVPLPGGEGVTFVDRVCDQLRSMPASIDKAGVFGGMTRAAQWCTAPEACSIFEMVHQGAPEYGSIAGEWDAVWAAGPWQASVGDKSALQGVPSTLLRSSSSIDEAGMRYFQMLGPVASTFDVAVKAKFPFKVKSPLAFAGLVVLPWVDVAIPSNMVRLLWASLGQQDFNFQAHAGQLSGPLAHGRLACCFEWGDRFPFRYSLDLLMKVLLGMYIGGWTVLANSVLRTATLAHIVIVVGMAAHAVVALTMRPHVSVLDSICAAAASGAVALAAGSAQFYRMGNDGPTAGCTIALTLLGILPLAGLFFHGILVSLFAARFTAQTPEETLARTASKWGLDYQNNARQAADVKILPSPGTSMEQVLPIALPACTSVALAHLKIKLPAPPAGAVSNALGGRPVLPVPADLLFAAASGLTYDKKSYQPLGAVITRQGGLVLYADPQKNQGKDWREAVKEYLQRERRADVVPEAVRTIQEQGRRLGERAFITMEVSE